MKSSDLDRRITLRRPQVRDDATSGEPLAEFVDEATVWAMRRVPRGGVAFDGSQRIASTDVVYTVRWTRGLDPSRAGGVDPTWRVRDGDQVAQVVAASTVERNVWIRIECTTRAETAAPDHRE